MFRKTSGFNISGCQNPVLALQEVAHQYLGQMIVGSDHRESRCMSLAKSMLYYNEIHDIHSVTENIRNVTPEQFREMAQLIITNGLNRLTLK